jgi:hypothetical protein
MMRGTLLSLGIAAVLCVDVRIDQVAYLNCLNEMFRGATKPERNDAPQNPAAMPAPAVGTYNQAAVHEMLGQSFGHSVVPQRPVQPAPPRLPR